MGAVAEQSAAKAIETKYAMQEPVKTGCRAARSIKDNGCTGPSPLGKDRRSFLFYCGALSP